MKLGINTYAYMWSIGFDGAWPKKPMSAMGLLEKTRELGLKVLQMGPNLPLLELPAKEFNAFVQQAKEWDITLELGTRGLETDHLTRQVELAAKMGARLLRTVAEISGKPVGADEIVRHFHNIEPLLKKEGVKLALENTVIPATELREALDRAKNDYMGIVLDTTNSLAVPEGWKQVAEILAPYVMCLHLKEFVIKRVWHMMGFVCEGMPAGKGQLDVPWLLDALKVSRYDFNVILEQWPPEQPEPEKTIALEQQWAVESVQYLRQFIMD